MIDKSEFMTTREVAEEAGVTVMTVNNWRDKGLKHYKSAGRVYYKKSEVVEFLKPKEVVNEPESL